MSVTVPNLSKNLEQTYFANSYRIFYSPKMLSTCYVCYLSVTSLLSSITIVVLFLKQNSEHTFIPFKLITSIHHFPHITSTKISNISNRVKFANLEECHIITMNNNFYFNSKVTEDTQYPMETNN